MDTLTISVPIIMRTYPERMLLPQCEVQRKGVYANDTPQTDKQCNFRGIFVIDGANLCRRHAGIIALDILLKATTEAIVVGETHGHVPHKDVSS